MTTTVPFFDMAAANAPYQPALRAAFDRVVASGDFGTGAEVATFEAELAAVTGAAHAVGVGSGTAALHLTLAAAGIGAGDEVILPANTFFATAEAIVATGARPVPVDIIGSTANIDPGAVEAAITPSTAAVIAVHLYGQPADMTRLQHIAASNDLFLVEDAAQAIGASWKGTPAGALGDAAAFSFYPTKNLGALGQAGAVTTSDGELARRVARLRAHGEDPRHVHGQWGHNERLDGLQAAFLRVKLSDLEAAQGRRDEAASRYEKLLSGADDIELIATDERARHVHHLFAVRVDDRDVVRARLAAHGVDSAVHYPTPVHLQPAAAALALPGSLPHAERHAATVLSLPLYPGIPPTHIDRCIEALVGT
jgi:dTDP-4-amino-4,6-dideoxygalactose transaminase